MDEILEKYGFYQGDLESNDDDYALIPVNEDDGSNDDDIITLQINDDEDDTAVLLNDEDINGTSRMESNDDVLNFKESKESDKESKKEEGGKDKETKAEDSKEKKKPEEEDEVDLSIQQQVACLGEFVCC